MYVTKELYDINHKLSNYFKLKENEELLKENKKLRELYLKSKSLALYPNAFAKKHFPFKLKRG